MANPIKNEQELFDQLRDTNSLISRDVWKYIYRNIEDPLSYMELMLSYYIERDEPVPKEELSRILDNIRGLFDVFKTLIHPELIQEGDRWVLVKESFQSIDKTVRHMLSHYIANDVQAVSFRVEYYLDGDDPFDKESCEKVLKHIHAMRDFLQRLKQNTETLEDRVAERLVGSLNYLHTLKNDPNAFLPEKLEECIRSLEDICQIVREGDNNVNDNGQERGMHG